MTTSVHRETKDIDATQVLLSNLGGTSGMLCTAIPVVAFVTANALAALPVAIGVALALVLTAFRVKRGEPIAQASGGLVGVIAAGGVAAWTGGAGSYFP